METLEFIKLAITGLLTGSITYFFTTRKLKKQFHHKMVESLYEKRFLTYTKLLGITQQLGKKQTSFEEHKKIRKELIDWIATSGGFLLLTQKSLSELNTMKDLLQKGKADNNGWKQDHIRKIFISRNNLRGCLRDEFKFFHSAEISV